jgi:hypothetical protein
MMSDCQLWRMILMHAVVNEKVIQGLFKFNLLGLLTLIGEYFLLLHLIVFRLFSVGSSFNKVLHQKPKWITGIQFIRCRKLFNYWTYNLLPVPCGLCWMIFLTFVKYSCSRILFSVPRMNSRKYKSEISYKEISVPFKHWLQSTGFVVRNIVLNFCNVFFVLLYISRC